MLHTDELNYELPPELIARYPAQPRDRSRLLVYHRAADSIDHRVFSDLPDLLNPGDLLIANDTRVMPAKLSLTKTSGGIITGLFIAELSPGTWRVLLRTRGRATPGMRLNARPANTSQPIAMILLQRESEKGQWIVAVNDPRPAVEVLADIGEVPLPPYIIKARGLYERATTVHKTAKLGGGSLDPTGIYDGPAANPPVEPTGGNIKDAERYQTIYAKAAGALAAPTAGLHFTPEVFARLAAHQVDHAWVTLHVGVGTFLPVTTPTLDQHLMHRESFLIPCATVQRIRRQRATAGRIVLVGTTTVRALETMASPLVDLSVPAQDFFGTTNLLIQPGYNFQLTDALITNFHLPRSTLMALVGALTGLDRLKSIYQQAIRRPYRFYSFGDAMLILP
ncbi:MAG: S-adenosylmethionine:tRNA ribosyltransferase-isomerase [Phycisphaerae bacterium]